LKARIYCRRAIDGLDNNIDRLKSKLPLGSGKKLHPAHFYESNFG
jgi:hypothetical protein